MKVLKAGILTLSIFLSGRGGFAEQVNPPPHTPPYPAHWWTPIEKQGAPSWEVLPQEAKYGEVIVSKRNELGLLSDFAVTPFVFHGRTFASVEGFWQSTKYPEDSNDPRAKFPNVIWPHKRSEVEAMTAFDAKNAGNEASTIMIKEGVDWVTFEGQKMTYKEEGESPFYKLVVQVMKSKLDQNANVKNVLLQTGELILRPDHSDSDAATLRAWQYTTIWTQFRSRLESKK